MERELSFPAHDGKTIYGSFIATTNKSCRGLIVYAHGLPSSTSDYTYLQSARLFAKLGYDSIRVSFYDWRDNARNLKECSFQEHTADLETTIRRYQKKYQSIYLIGHSWGGPTIMQTNCKSVAAVSLWDPSYNVPFWWDKCTRTEGKKIYLTGPCDCLISPAMHRAAKALDYEGCRKLAKNFAKPLQVLHAKKDGLLYKFKNSYHTWAQGPTDYHLIKDADHQFLDEGAIKEAVQFTDKWFKKFS